MCVCLVFEIRIIVFGNEVDFFIEWDGVLGWCFKCNEKKWVCKSMYIVCVCFWVKNI